MPGILGDVRDLAYIKPWAKKEGVWAKSAFCGQKAKFAGQKKFMHNKFRQTSIKSIKEKPKYYLQSSANIYMKINMLHI